MGMDGLSFSSTGAIKETTSAEYNNKTEQAILSDPTNSSKQVQGLNNNMRVRQRSDDEEGRNKQQEQSEKEQEEVFEDGFIEEEHEEELEEADIDLIENPNKDFYVKLNVKDDIIELYDNTTNKLIETISGNELGELIQKLNMASGIFVNKKV